MYTVSTPSSGLTPERQETFVSSYSLRNNGKILTSISLPPNLNPQDFDRILPTTYGFMAGDANTLHGFDPETLQPTWTVNGPSNCCSLDTNFEGIAAIDRGFNSSGLPNGTEKYVFYNAADGGPVGDFVGDFDSATPGGFVVNDNRYPAKHSFFDMQTRQLSGPIAAEGVFWADTRLSWNSGNFIEVWDRTTNSFPFSRSGQDAVGLHFSTVDIAGKYLYITNESDSPVIDWTTSQKVSSGWKIRPTDQINRDWTLVKRGKNTDQDGNIGTCFRKFEFICSSDKDRASLTLSRTPNGQYDGPWF